MLTDPIEPVKGIYVKKADDILIKLIKDAGRLVQKDNLDHSYPFCWRSDTPLIYKAVPSWFINVEEIRDRLIKNNNGTYWFPNSVKEGRFHNWLVDVRDWAVSRNRFLGKCHIILSTIGNDPIFFSLGDLTDMSLFLPKKAL
jgi:isoleucyl-tRNA synthetase